MKTELLKRSAALALTIIMCGASVVGCSDSKSSSRKLYKAGETEGGADEEGQEEVQEAKLDYVMVLNGYCIGFPVKRSDLLALGWTPAKEGEISGYYEKDGVKIMMRMCEESGDDYIIHGMTVSTRNNADVEYSLMVDKGVSLQTSSKEDVENLYGEPDVVTEKGEYFYFEGDVVPSTSDECKEQRGHLGFGFDDAGMVKQIFILD